MDMTVEVPELPELTFDEASHIYRLNGDIIPSVSELMEPLKDQCYGGISKRTLENAAIKGSAVHNSIENWIKFGIDDIPSEHRGYFNGFVEWWKQYKPRVFGSEVRIYLNFGEVAGFFLCQLFGSATAGGRLECRNDDRLLLVAPRPGLAISLRRLGRRVGRLLRFRVFLACGVLQAAFQQRRGSSHCLLGKIKLNRQARTELVARIVHNTCQVQHIAVNQDAHIVLMAPLDGMLGIEEVGKGQHIVHRVKGGNRQ